MALHSPIINYINEKWFFDLIKDCKKITQKYKDIEDSKNDINKRRRYNFS